MTTIYDDVFLSEEEAYAVSECGESVEEDEGPEGCLEYLASVPMTSDQTEELLARLERVLALDEPVLNWRSRTGDALYRDPTIPFFHGLSYEKVAVLAARDFQTAHTAFEDEDFMHYFAHTRPRSFDAYRVNCFTLRRLLRGRAPSKVEYEVIGCSSDEAWLPPGTFDTNYAEGGPFAGVAPAQYGPLVEEELCAPGGYMTAGEAVVTYPWGEETFDLEVFGKEVLFEEHKGLLDERTIPSSFHLLQPGMTSVRALRYNLSTWGQGVSVEMPDGRRRFVIVEHLAPQEFYVMEEQRFHKQDLESDCPGLLSWEAPERYASMPLGSPVVGGRGTVYVCAKLNVVHCAAAVLQRDEHGWYVELGLSSGMSGAPFVGDDGKVWAFHVESHGGRDYFLAPIFSGTYHRETDLPVTRVRDDSFSSGSSLSVPSLLSFHTERTTPTTGSKVEWFAGAPILVLEEDSGGATTFKSVPYTSLEERRGPPGELPPTLYVFEGSTARAESVALTDKGSVLRLRTAIENCKQVNKFRLATSDSMSSHAFFLVWVLSARGKFFVKSRLDLQSVLSGVLRFVGALKLSVLGGTSSASLELKRTLWIDALGKAIANVPVAQLENG